MNIFYTIALILLIQIQNTIQAIQLTQYTKQCQMNSSVIGVVDVDCLQQLLLVAQ